MLLHGEEPMSPVDAERLSPLRLAYIGDTVWDLLVRSRVLFQGLNLHHMHEEAIQAVNAGAQAAAFRAVDPVLTEKEASIARRGRNAHARHPAPKHQSPEDYQAATALETLIGYLYLTGQEDRIRELCALSEKQTNKEVSHAPGKHAL